jgi:serine/threonine-protein phosphatase 2A regulatory subunit B'
MELNAVSLDGDIPGDLDESGIERVPMADPGLEVSGISTIYNLGAPVYHVVSA